MVTGQAIVHLLRPNADAAVAAAAAAATVLLGSSETQTQATRASRRQLVTV